MPLRPFHPAQRSMRGEPGGTSTSKRRSGRSRRAKGPSAELLEARQLLAASLPVVSVSAPDPNLTELGNGGTFHFTRTGSTKRALAVSYTLGGTATVGVDYQGIGQIKFPKGTSEIDRAVTPLNDTTVEGSETIVLRVQPSTGYRVSSKPSAKMTIADDDPPTVSIVALDSLASETFGNTATFNVVRQGDSSAALSISYAVSGSAVEGQDYQFINNVVIPAGQTSATVTMQPIDDSVTEQLESFTFQILASNHYKLGENPSFNATIVDNDMPQVSLVSIDNEAAETSGGGANSGQIFVGRVGGNQDLPLTLSFTLGGTAGSGDYDPITEVVIPAGEASTIVTINPIDDVNLEGDETAILTINTTSNYVIAGPASGTVVIHDNETPLLSIVASDDTASESGGTGAFTVTRFGDLSVALNMQFSLSGTAGAGQDFSPISFVLLPAGQASVVVPITPIDDNAVEGIETVTMDILPGTGYVVTNPSSATVNINDDEVPKLSIAASITPAAEPNQNGQFTFTLSGSVGAAITVQYTLSGTATQGKDYQTVGTVTIPSAATTFDLPLVVLDDADTELDETVTITLQPDPSYTIDSAASAATVTISDADPPEVEVFAITSLADEDGQVAGQLKFTRFGSAASDLTLTYSLSGTAVEGQDYPVIGPVIFPAGEISVTVDILPINDPTPESLEELTLTLTADPTYTIGASGSASITIARSDLPVASVVATDAIAAEPGADSGKFRITLSSPAAADTTIEYDLLGTATLGLDYDAFGTVFIPAGLTFVDVPVVAANDVDTEGTETIVLQLVATDDYSLKSDASAATVEILDDEPPLVTIETLVDSATEGGADGVLRITRSGGLDQPLTVPFLLQGTAGEGADYFPISPIVIPANQTSIDIHINAVEDDLVESDEVVTMYLVGSLDAFPGNPDHASVTIFDGNSPILTVAPLTLTASEGNPAPAQFRVSRVGSTQDDLPVLFALSGSATAGADYQLVSQIVVPAGQSFVDVPILPINDPTPESTENVTLALLFSETYTLDPFSSATVQITDNDLPIVSLGVSKTSIREVPVVTGTETENTTFITLRRIGDSTLDLIVDVEFVGSAEEVLDFVLPVFVIPAGQSTASFPITAIADSLPELTEDATFTLVDSIEYVVDVAHKSATIDIEDGDPPLLSASSADPVMSESGLDPGSITVTRVGDLSAELTILYSFTGTATQNVDFSGGTFVMPANATSVTVPVTPVDDKTSEGRETVIFNLLPSSFYTVDTTAPSTTLVIDDNEPTSVTISATSSTLAEGGQQGGIRFTRVGDISTPLAINYAVSGTATPGIDFAPLAAALIPAGLSSVTVALTTIADTIPEPTESIIVTLGSSPDYVIGTSSSATVSVLDNDDGTPPSGAVASVGKIIAGAKSIKITVDWTDDIAVAAASLANGNIQVVSPSGVVQNLDLLSVSSISNSPTIRAVYRFLTPGGSWNIADNGVYSIYVHANQVKDAIGNAAPRQKIGTFKVKLPISTKTAARTAMAATSASNASAVLMARHEGLFSTEPVAF